MTIPTEQQLTRLGLMPRPLRERLRDRGSLTLLSVGFAGVVASVLSIFSIGVFIGAGLFACFVLGAVVYPTPSRWKVAIGGSAWSIFCLVVVIIALLHD